MTTVKEVVSRLVSGRTAWFFVTARPELEVKPRSRPLPRQMSRPRPPHKPKPPQAGDFASNM